MSHVTGIQVQRNKAIVGQNAFAHEAGIHQDGMLKDRTTYEIMNPEDVGLPQTELVLGKHSGRHALRQRVIDLGYHLDEEQLQKVFEASRCWPIARRTIYDADIEALAEAQIHSGPACGRWRRSPATPAPARSRRRRSACGTRTAPFTRGQPRRRPRRRRVQGHRAHHRHRGAVRDYRVRSVTVGEDAQGEAQVEAEYEGKMLSGRGLSTDIIEAMLRHSCRSSTGLPCGPRSAIEFGPRTPILRRRESVDALRGRPVPAARASCAEDTSRGSCPSAGS